MEQPRNIDLALDLNNDYLYSSSKEGVVIIWNIHTWVNSFLPRFGEPVIGIKVTNVSKNLVCFLKNNSKIFINLAKMRIIDVINSVSNECLINKFCLKIKDKII